MVRELSLTKSDTMSPSEAYSAPAGYFHSPTVNLESSSSPMVGVSSPLPSTTMVDNRNFQPNAIVGRAASFSTATNYNRSATPKIRRFELSSTQNYRSESADNWTTPITSPDTEPNEILKHLMSSSFSQDDDFGGNFSLPENLNFASNEFFSSNVRSHAQNIVNAPRCSSAARACSRAVSDSPSCASYGTSVSSELDDSVILDEILSMEEEQQLRRARIANSGSKNGEEPDQPETILLLDEISLHNKQIVEPNQSNRQQNLFRIREDSEHSSEAATIFCSDKEENTSGTATRGPVIMRDRRKKDVHNMIERRRRYNINDKIRELGSLLPKSRTQDMKMNKGSILRASVEYLRVVNHNQERMLELVKQQQILECENKRMLKRIQELEQELRSHGLVVPACSPDFPKSVVKNTATVSPFVNIVKTEPADDESYVENRTIQHCVDLTVSSQNSGQIYEEITCDTGLLNDRISRQQKFCDSRRAIRNVINARGQDPLLNNGDGHSHLYGGKNGNDSLNVKTTLAGRRQPSSSVIRDLLLSQATTRRDGTPTAIAGASCPASLSRSSSPAVQRPSTSSSANGVLSLSSAAVTVDSLTSYLLNDFCTPPTSSSSYAGDQSSFNIFSNCSSNSLENHRLMNDVLQAAAAAGQASYAPSPVHLSTLLGGVGDDDWCMMNDAEAVDDTSSSNNFNFDSTTRDQADFVLA